MSQEIVPVQPAEFYADERETFDRMDGESKGEFELFRKYRELGRRRTYGEVAQFFGIARYEVQKTAARHSWQLRSRAFDAYLDQQREADLDSRQMEVREQHAQMAKEIRERIMSRFNSMDLYQVSPRDMPAYMELAWKMERQAVGLAESTKKIEVTGKDGGPIQVVSDMTAEERRDRMAELAAALAKQIASSQALEAEEDEIHDADVVDESDA